MSLLHRAPGEQRDEGDEHGDARARAVLGDGAGRHVHMDVRLLERGRVDAERRRARLDQAERGLRAFLHDVAELTGEDQLAAARHARRLDEQDVAADRSPGKPGRHARNARAHGHLALEAAGAEDAMQVLGLDLHVRFGLAFGDAHRDVMADGADLALEIAHAGLARVVANDGADRVLGDLGTARRSSPVASSCRFTR